MAAQLCLHAHAHDQAVSNATDSEFAGATFSKLSPEEKSLLAEYRKYYQRLKQFYDNVTMESREERYAVPRSVGGIVPPAPAAGLELAQKRHIVYRANDGMYYRVDDTVYDVSDPAKVKELRTGIVTPTDSFLFRRNSPGGPFFLVAHPEDKSESLATLSTYWFRNAAIADGPMQLEHMLFRDTPNYVIESISRARRGSRHCFYFAAFRQPARWLGSQGLSI